MKLDKDKTNMIDLFMYENFIIGLNNLYEN